MFSAEDWIMAVKNQITLTLQDEPTKANTQLLAALYVVQDKLCGDNDIQQIAKLQYEPIPEPILIGRKQVSDFILVIEHEMEDCENYQNKGNRVIAKSEYQHANMFVEQSKRYAFTRDEQVLIKGLQIKLDAIGQKVK